MKKNKIMHFFTYIKVIILFFNVFIVGNVYAEALELTEGKKVRLPDRKYAQFSVGDKRIAKIWRHPLTEAVYLQGVKEGITWVVAVPLNGLPEKKVSVRVIGKPVKKKKSLRKRLAKPKVIQGWGS